MASLDSRLDLVVSATLLTLLPLLMSAASSGPRDLLLTVLGLLPLILIPLWLDPHAIAAPATVRRP